MIRNINSVLLRIIDILVSPLRIAFIHYNYPIKALTYAICKKIRKESRTLLSIHELYVLYQAAHSTMGITGDLAEVGVYKGGSAKLLCLLKGKKTIYLFDTFTGLPEITHKDDYFHRKNMYKESITNVRSYLAEFKNVKIQEGIFPKSALSVNSKKFCFVHLDIDLYKGTLQSLQYFWPRMSKGGIIVIHDYPVLDGIKNAVSEFVKQKNVGIVEIPSAQAVLIKS